MAASKGTWVLRGNLPGRIRPPSTSVFCQRVTLGGPRSILAQIAMNLVKDKPSLGDLVRWDTLPAQSPITALLASPLQTEGWMATADR